MNVPTLAVRQSVRLPADYYAPRVRAGHALARGVAPVAGERALLTGLSCYSVFGPVSIWFWSNASRLPTCQ